MTVLSAETTADNTREPGKAGAAGFRHLGFSVRNKIILLAASIAFYTALAVGAVNYVHVVDLTYDRAAAKLRTQASLIAPQLQAAYNGLRADALTISRMPPFQGLARTLPQNGPDPYDGSTVAQWRQRLETIFSSVMAERPDYMQLRFIGFADGGREIVRVDRTDGEIRAVPVEKLQRKANAPYFIDSLTLPAGAVHFSEIALNEDYGRIDRNLPVIRAVTPVYGPRGNLFGFMVIDAHAGQLLRSVLSHIETDGDVAVVTNAGDYILRQRHGEASKLYLAGAALETAPELVQILHSAIPSDQTATHRLSHQDYAVHVSRLNFDSTNPTRFLKIALAVPEDAFLSEAQATRKATLWSGTFLVLFASLLALAAAHMVTQPLHRIVEETRAYAGGDRRINLPVDRQDEIGALSRAFTDLIDRLEAARRAESGALSRMRTIRRDAVDALITTDEKGIILEFNKSAERLFGYRASKALGQNVSLIVPKSHKARHDGYLDDYRRTGERKVIGNVRALEGQRKDGSVFPAELRVSEINVDGKRIYDGIVRDISERYEMERKVAEYTAALERSNQNLDEFAYIASHDLKEPLRGIANHVTFLQEDFEEVLGEDGNRRIERLRELALRADKLTSELLEWSRLGRTTLELDAIDLNEIVEEVRASLADTIDEHATDVVVTGRLPIVSGDRSRIVSVFMNLVVNGIKYNDSPQKRIEIGCIADGTTPEGRRDDIVFVRDNGIGIAAEHHAAVFAIFKRLNHEKAYGAGTGAGLSFVKKIVERHGGEIWLDSKPGKGTTFYFTLRGNP